MMANNGRELSFESERRDNSLGNKVFCIFIALLIILDFFVAKVIAKHINMDIGILFGVGAIVVTALLCPIAINLDEKGL